MSEFIVRLLTSVIGIILLILVLYFNGLFLSISIFLLTLIALLEINNAFRKIDINNNNLYFIIISIINAVELYFREDLTITFYFILFISLFNLLFKRKNIIDVATMSFNMIYVILGFSSIVLIKDPIFIGLVFIIAFSTDSFAYLVGSTLGKHKLIPDVSPKKSIEGSIGGIVGTVIILSIYLYFYDHNNYLNNIIFGITGSIVAQIGDLVASRIKRDTNIKDFGKIIPGHGGVLDRFDSVILLSPVVLAIVKMFYI